jgi:hypothetical protein
MGDRCSAYEQGRVITHQTASDVVSLDHDDIDRDSFFDERILER